MNRKLKKRTPFIRNRIRIEFSCNIINIFTVILDQFSAFLLNLFSRKEKKKLADPKFY